MTFPRLRTTDAFVAPGEFYAGFAPARVWTILGSCISLVLWHPGLHFGVMSHFLLPDRAKGRRYLHPDARYGDESGDLVLAALRSAGVPPSQCQARLFGGGSMFGKQASTVPDIGHRNAAAAYAFLEHHDIQLVCESLYGRGHRRICFDIASGRMWMQHGKLDEFNPTISHQSKTNQATTNQASASQVSPKKKAASIT